MRLGYFVLAIALLGCAESKEVKLQRFLQRGNAAVKTNNIQQGITYYKEAIQIDPCFEEALNNLGTVYFRQKRYDLAINNYEQAIACDPEFIDSYYNRANTYYELKEYYGALKDLDKIVQVNPDTAVVHFTRD